MHNSVDIFLLQEHWLFDFELSELSEIYPKILGKGKAVDTDDPIPATYLPRGYGGVAILWKKELDKFIKHLPDGSNRIQCIRIEANKPIIIISVYFPTKSSSDSYESFCDCLDQLHEIIMKYGSSHDIIIGGDLNEDIYNDENKSGRKKRLLQFIEECNLTTNQKGPTFINVAGVDTSEIDYFLYPKNRSLLSRRIIDLPFNVSDHHPISLEIQCQLAITTTTKKDNQQSRQKIKWDKVDKISYRTDISTEIIKHSDNLQLDNTNLELTITEVFELLTNTAKKHSKQKSYGKNVLKLNIWNEEISTSLLANKKAYKNWKNAGRPEEHDNILLLEKKRTRKIYRTAIRKEELRKKHLERNDIINCNRDDKQQFYKLVRKHRKNGNCFINDLHVEDKYYERDEIIDGWHSHFSKLAIPTENNDFDYEHLELCDMDYKSIQRISQHYESKVVDLNVIEEAVRSINRGKAEDIFGISIEHFLYAGSEFMTFLHNLVNILFKRKLIPDMIKVGLLSPVFKNKGEKNNSKNYRGITVLPILLKIIEYILRLDLRSGSLRIQSPLQRGFTTNTSPMNAAVVVEEIYREYKDENLPFFIALLDAKSAFDVVVLKMILRKVYLSGTNLPTWLLIDEIHNRSESCIKWTNQISEKFPVLQGVKQGGLLSADLYKIYLEDLLETYEQTSNGCQIGNITVNAVACADDVALLSNNPTELQFLVNLATQYSSKHHYNLQPQKSVIIPVKSTLQKKNSHQINVQLNGQEMPIIDESSHLGIMRSTSIQKTQTATIERNINKARKTAYSLMSIGMHGENGIDPITAVHLYKTFVQPTLTFGLEVITPVTANLLKLEKFQKQLLKRIFSLPISAPDPAVYILSGLLPIEAQIDQKILTLFNNICRQDDNSLEKSIALRQTIVKDNNSNSWFTTVRKILYKYALQNPMSCLENPQNKNSWKKEIQTKINHFWKEKLIKDSSTYRSLEYLGFGHFNIGKPHRILNISNACDPTRETLRLVIKLKLITGTYILESKRSKYSNESSKCKLCDMETEDLAHFLINCKILEPIRSHYINRIEEIIDKFSILKYGNMSEVQKIQILMDNSVLYSCTKEHVEMSNTIEQLSRQLVHALHIARYRTLNIRKK